MEHTIDFCTLGMFIIDEIELNPSTPPLQNIPGGAGTWAALGARIMSPPPTSKRVGWIVDAGHDFPSSVRDEIQGWQTGVLLRETPERLTTRGWNGYAGNEERAFKYTTPKLRLDATSLTTELLAAKAFHLICSPERAIDLVKTITARREKEFSEMAVPKAMFIWEPVPDLCRPQELKTCYQTLRYVDVISPNDNELCAFFGRQRSARCNQGYRQKIERCSEAWLDAGIGADQKGSVIVRAGKEGCFVLTKTRRTWLPAYHLDGERVKDPTGGGNAFLGGFATGLVQDSPADNEEKVVEAALWGSVAASFAIEQIGMPKVSLSEDSKELWNGESAWDRLETLKQRVK